MDDESNPSIAAAELYLLVSHVCSRHLFKIYTQPIV